MEGKKPQCVWAMLLLFITLVPSSGCVALSSLMGRKRSPELDTSLLKAAGYNIPPGGLPAPVQHSPSAGPRIALEVRSEGDKPHVETIPMPTDRAVFLQDIVQQAALHEKLGRSQISIMRPVDPQSPPVRLDATINSEGKTTTIASNYALLPGDHLIVYPDQRSSFERFVEKQFGM